jgi:hypothetical protein
MKRRTFLTITGLTGAVAAITGFKFINTSFENASAKLIKNELNFLSLDEKGLEEFVREYSKNKDTRYRLTMRGYSFMGIGSKQSGKVNQMVTAYLLSTDLFTNKMDENKIVKYVGLYDPYQRPCANPFSSAYYPSSSV